MSRPSPQSVADWYAAVSARIAALRASLAAPPPDIPPATAEALERLDWDAFSLAANIASLVGMEARQ